MKRILLTSTILAVIGGPAFATSFNDINIDASTNGSVKALSIQQDDTATTGNLVSGETTKGTADSGVALPVKGAWNKIAITQTGGKNTLSGGFKTASVSGGTSTATLTAAYTTTGTGKNVHSLNIGTTTAPTDPTVTISVSNNGASDNTIADTLDSTSLAYNLKIAGTGNQVTNTIAASSGITLNQGDVGTGSYGIFGNNNHVTNLVSGVTNFTHNLTVNGNGNTILNTANTSSLVTDATITQAISGAGGNSVKTTLASTASGTQTTSLTVSGTSVVDYVSTAAGDSQSSTITLANVVGASGAAAQVVVAQTNAAGSAQATLNVDGGGFTAGALATGLAGAPALYAPSVYVYQNSPGALLNASVTGAANGYTVSFKQ